MSCKRYYSTAKVMISAGCDGECIREVINKSKNWRIFQVFGGFLGGFSK